MTLYHFCPAHMLASIRKIGLTLGKFPVIGGDRVALIDGIQWLTAEADADKQSWATSALITYSRTACRLTVEIPDGHQRKLYRAIDFVQTLTENSKRFITDWPGSEQWYVYCGKIPTHWITEVVRMERKDGENETLDA